MNTTDKYLVLGLSVIALSIVAYSIASFLNVTDVSGPSGERSPSFPSILTGTTETGDVAIELTPQGIVEGVLTVNIAANTHSVELSQFNLQEIATLKYDGQEATPSSVPVLGGHHSSGTIQFPISTEINSFVITIKGIPKVQERVYRW